MCVIYECTKFLLSIYVTSLWWNSQIVFGPFLWKKKVEDGDNTQSQRNFTPPHPCVPYIALCSLVLWSWWCKQAAGGFCFWDHALQTIRSHKLAAWNCLQYSQLAHQKNNFVLPQHRTPSFWYPGYVSLALSLNVEIMHYLFGRVESNYIIECKAYEWVVFSPLSCKQNPIDYWIWCHAIGLIYIYFSCAAQRDVDWSTHISPETLSLWDDYHTILQFDLRLIVLLINIFL